MQGLIRGVAAPGAAALLILLTTAGRMQDAPARSTVESARLTGEIRLENAPLEEVARQSDAAGTKNDLPPGEWENRVELVALALVDAPPETAARMKAELGKSRIGTTCRTGEDTKLVDLSRLPESADGCVFPRYHIAGGKIDAVMECNGTMGKSHMTITGNQSATTYDLVMIRRQTAPGQTGESSITMKLSGRRLGACRK